MELDSNLFLEPVKEFLEGTTSSSCSVMAETFLQIVPESAQFQVALNILLPIMSDITASNQARIQASYVLWYLYRNHSLSFNPFHASFRETLDSEKALPSSSLSSNAPSLSPVASTLQMILTGKGFELATHSPDSLIMQWPFSKESISPRSIVSTASGSSGPPDPDVDDVSVARQLLQYASDTVLGIPEYRALQRILPTVPIPLPTRSEIDDVLFPLHDLHAIVSNNPGNLAYQLLSQIIVQSSDDARAYCWPVLGTLSPSLATFDLWTRLLRDNRLLALPDSDEQITVAASTRKAALSAFLSHCDDCVDRMQNEDGGRDGRQSGVNPVDGCIKAIQNFSKFCLLLLRSRDDSTLGVWSVGLEEEEWFGITTVIQSFALRYSMFEGASELYRMTVQLGQMGG